MKAIKLNLKVGIILLCVLMAGCLFLPFATTKNFADAENFSSETIGDTNFSVQMSANARRASASLQKTTKTVSASIGNETLTYEYFCFNWRDISYLKFKLNSSITHSSSTFSSCELRLTYIETENLNSSFGNGLEETLYQTTIENNSFSPVDFYYYIDSDASINESKVRSKGNDFGIYKFDFCYVYSDEDVQNVKKSIGEFYVAIVPDDIDTITHENMQILYTVSSSNKLMNIFNLYLSRDYYKYVNPKYVQWVVEGVDKNNFNYVYSQKMIDENISYANCKAIWQTPPVEPCGNSFVMDTNDIEGQWTAYCIIKNSQGVETARFAAENLSTIKHQPKSYTWLILIIVCSVLLAGGLVALLVFYIKRDKIW